MGSYDDITTLTSDKNNEIMINTVILLSSVLASVRPEVMTRGEAVSVVFPVQDDKVLVNRQSENIDAYNDNIAVDSSTAVSKVAPMMGQMYSADAITNNPPEPEVAAVEAVPEEKVDVVAEDKVEVAEEKVESDPGNTYLQVGKWIAQWDAPYEAWYYYNSESGVSTWSKPKELDGIEFTDPIPDINDARKKVQQAHLIKEQELESEINNEVGVDGVRLERDKPFDPFGVNQGHAHGHGHHQDHHHADHHAPVNNVQSPVSFTSSSPLTQHNSLSIGPSPTKRPAQSQVADPIFHQNFNKPTTTPQTLSQLNINLQKPPGKPNGFTAPADTGYGSPTQADTGYGSPTQPPNNNYAAPALQST